MHTYMYVKVSCGHFIIPIKFYQSKMQRKAAYKHICDYRTHLVVAYGVLNRSQTPKDIITDVFFSFCNNIFQVHKRIQIPGSAHSRELRYYAVNTCALGKARLLISEEIIR